MSYNRPFFVEKIILEIMFYDGKNIKMIGTVGNERVGKLTLNFHI
jgi:hypothetical protein